MGREKKSKTVRKHLFQADIEVLMRLRGQSENNYTELKGDPGVYRPRTTPKEWKAILVARKAAQKEETRKAPPKREVSRILSNIYVTEAEKVEEIKRVYNASHNEVMGWLDGWGHEAANEQFARAINNPLKKSSRYIVVSAQNNVHVHAGFLKNLEKFAKEIGATIIVIPTRYNNTNALQSSKNYWWDSCIDKYLIARDVDVLPTVRVLGGLRVVATAVHPTSQLEAFSDGKTVIVGASKIELRSLPIFPEDANIFAISTGSCTINKFTDSKAGGKAGLHASLGFTLVEQDLYNEEVAYTTPVSAERNGDFTCFNFRMQGGKFLKNVKLKAMMLGDSHVEAKDCPMNEITKRLIKKFGVGEVFINDLFNAHSISVHTKDAVERYRLAKENQSDIAAEIEGMYNYLDWFESNVDKTTVLKSNHCDMMDRRVRQVDFENLGGNALVVAELLVKLLKGQTSKDFKGLIPDLVNSKYSKVLATGGADKVRISNSDIFALHGHSLHSGARGSVRGLANFPFKTMSGHTHACEISSGAMVVGIGNFIPHHYASGSLTRWTVAHGLVSEQNKRQLAIFHKFTHKFTSLYDY